MAAPLTAPAAEGYEVVIVGGGAAGLSAALVLGRARRRTLLFDVGGQSNRADAHVGGGLALDGTPPDELYARGREQVAAYASVTVEDVEVTDARREGDDFVVVAGGREVPTRSLILATGMDYEVPDIPGFREHWGGQVFHCPFCHGWEVRDRKLVVCADGEAAAHLGPLIGGWSDDVTVIAPGDVSALREEAGVVQAAVLKDGTEVVCEAVLVHAPLRQRGHLAEALGLQLTDMGLIEVDSLGHTSAPGVYAAGDAAVAPQQVPVAMASGHLAGIAAVRELLLGRPA